MFPRRLLSFRTRHQPYMVRLSYRYELRSALTFPLAASLAEGSFTGVVAAKYFLASPLLIAVITAAPMFGNIMALFWAELSRTRRKVPFVNMLQLGVVLTIASVALTGLLPLRAVQVDGEPQLAPVAIAGWIFAAQIILARVLAAGIVTVRSVIWRANYPRHIRGQIIGRITVVATAVLALATFIGSAWLDRNPRAFVWLYPGAAMLGAIGIWQFGHIRVRKEGQLLRSQPIYTPRPENLSQTDETNVMNYEATGRRGLRVFFLDAWQVLREDAQFRRYQRYQFISGFAFMFFGPSLLYMVSRELTDGRTQYLLATVVLQIVPLTLTLLATQLWAPLFDRVHITTFRTIQTSVSLLAQATIFAGALWASYFQSPPGMSGALAIVTLGQMFVGISLAGGNLAWNLGHADFAPREKDATYMGVHVMLTGLRGCIAPFCGAWLYQVPWIGKGVFAISTCLCAIAVLGFISMSRHAPPKQRHR